MFGVGVWAWRTLQRKHFPGIVFTLLFVLLLFIGGRLIAFIFWEVFPKIKKIIFKHVSGKKISPILYIFTCWMDIDELLAKFKTLRKELNKVH